MLKMGIYCDTIILTGCAFEMDTNFFCTYSGGDLPLSSIRPKHMYDAEWRKDDGLLELWLSYTQADYVPSWARQGTAKALDPV
jgi:hypothetical protein